MAADVTRIKPGSTFRLAFVFDIAPQWHIYWINPGASGGPTEVDVRVPPGFVVGRTLFPRPTVIPTSEGPCYGYEQQTAVFVEVTAPDTAMSQLSFSADLSWMVCKEICKVGGTSVMLSLPFGQTSIDAGTGDAEVARFKRRLPAAFDAPGASALFEDSVLTLTAPAGSHSTFEFFPAPSPGVEFGEATSETAGRTLRVRVPVTLKPNNALGKPLRISGVLGVGQTVDDPSYWFDIPLGRDGQPLPVVE